MSSKKLKRPAGGRGPRESRPCILLIDDDVVDKIAIRRALDRLDHSLDVIGAESGIEGLELLRGENGRRKIKPPMIVVLDLNMPRMGGLEFLRQLREDSELCSIVVFVCTTSGAAEDIAEAYRYNVAGYVRKAQSADSFTNIADLLGRYLGIVNLP